MEEWLGLISSLGKLVGPGMFLAGLVGEWVMQMVGRVSRLRVEGCVGVGGSCRRPPGRAGGGPPVRGGGGGPLGLRVGGRCDGGMYSILSSALDIRHQT